MEIGRRTPKDYFWVIGWGESDVGIEIGSYDAALTMAGIENFNVMLYTSVLSPEAIELPHLPDIHYGSVLEGIIAVQHTDPPATRITAGPLLTRVLRKSDESYSGGFACEYAGNGSIEEAEANLREAMQQLFARLYQTRFYEREFRKSLVRTHTPEKSFGTIVVGVGFASYLVPGPILYPFELSLHDGAKMELQKLRNPHGQLVIDGGYQNHGPASDL